MTLKQILEQANVVHFMMLVGQRFVVHFDEFGVEFTFDCNAAGSVNGRPTLFFVQKTLGIQVVSEICWVQDDQDGALGKWLMTLRDPRDLQGGDYVVVVEPYQTWVQNQHSGQVRW